MNASRRLLARLARGGARGLLEGAPGLVTTLGMFLVVSLGTVAALSVGVVMSFAWKGANVGDTGAVLVCLGYGGAFFVFSTGFLALLRARGASSLLSRLVTIGVLAAASLGPPIFALIVKATTDVPNTDDLLPLMAPSPLFAGVMCEAVGHTYRAAAQTQLAVGAFCMACWTALGAVLFLIARARAASAARAAL